MKKLRVFFTFLAMGWGIVFYSCSSGGGEKTSEPKTTQTEVSSSDSNKSDDQAMMLKGEQIYKSKCFACHQLDGKGIAKTFPPLVGSDFLLNHTVMAATQALNGSEAVPAHSKIKYPAPMPPQVSTKEDAVAVINYVLKIYNHSDKRITVEDLANVEITPR